MMTEMMWYTLMMRSMAGSRKKFEKKLMLIYPELSQEQSQVIVKQLFIFWENIIENYDKIKQ